MTLYKITDQNGETYDHTKWGLGVAHSGTGSGPLCGPGWIHAYTHPLLAVFLNPIYGAFQNPRLWVAMGDVVKTDHGLKVGCKSLMTTCEIDVPKVTIEQRVRFAILCALRSYKNVKWRRWAKAWLSGEDRSASDARAAAANATYAAAHVADSAAYAAAHAANSAAYAAVAAAIAAAHVADSAAYAADAADSAAYAADSVAYAAVAAAIAAAHVADSAAYAADAADSAAYAANAAAYAAAYAADVAANTTKGLDLIQLAQLAVS